MKASALRSSCPRTRSSSRRRGGDRRRGRRTCARAHPRRRVHGCPHAGDGRHRGHAPDPRGGSRHQGDPDHDRRIARRHLRSHPGGRVGLPAEGRLRRRAGRRGEERHRRQRRDPPAADEDLHRRGPDGRAGGSAAADDTALSKREREILQKVADGSTTRQVATELGISPHTVKTHLERIFEKLGANDRAQAVAIAIRHRHRALGARRPEPRARDPRLVHGSVAR